MKNRGWNKEMVEDLVSVCSQNTTHHHLNPCYKEPALSQDSVFMLKNWSITKGSGSMDLMVCGDLRDVYVISLIFYLSIVQRP